MNICSDLTKDELEDSDEDFYQEKVKDRFNEYCLFFYKLNRFKL